MREIVRVLCSGGVDRVQPVRDGALSSVRSTSIQDQKLFPPVALCSSLAPTRVEGCSIRWEAPLIGAELLLLGATVTTGVFVTVDRELHLHLTVRWILFLCFCPIEFGVYVT